MADDRADFWQLEAGMAGDSLKKSQGEVERIKDLLLDEQIASGKTEKNINTVKGEKNKLEKSNKKLSGMVESLELEKNGLREFLTRVERKLQVLETEKADQKKEFERFEKETNAHTIAVS
jgi:chromosome segregation ATPase